MLTQARLTAYIVTFLGAVGVIAAGLGWATFDPTSGTIDFAPFNIYVLAPIVAAPVMSLVAALAVVFKWGPSK